MAVVFTNGVQEGSLGMVTTFCCHDPAKVEPLEVLFTLLQQDSPKPMHSGDEDTHQFTLPPMGVFWLPLSGCNHSFSGNVNCPVPTGWAVPIQTAPFFVPSGHPAA